MNGLSGTVKSLNDGSMSVHYYELRDTHFQHDPHPFPCMMLKQISFSLSLKISKNQEMTLPDIMVDHIRQCHSFIPWLLSNALSQYCEGVAFDPGQIAVTLALQKPYNDQELVDRAVFPTPSYHKWVLWNEKRCGRGWHQVLFHTILRVCVNLMTTMMTCRWIL